MVLDQRPDPDAFLAPILPLEGARVNVDETFLHFVAIRLALLQ